MKKYYPWIICGACVLLHFCICGMAATAFSTYMPYIKDAAGLTNTETSMITTIRCLVTMIAMFFSEKFYKKVSMRWGIFIACLLMPISCIIFAVAKSALVCYLGAVVMGISYAFGTMIPIALLIRRWFDSLRSTALAIAVCGSGISIAVTPTIITYLVEYHGLSAAFWAEGLFIAAAAILLLIIVRDNPEELGLEPYRTKRQVVEKIKKKGGQIDMAKSDVVFFVIVMILLGLSGTPYTHHLTIRFVTAGYTAVQAATAFSLYGVFLVISKILFGVGTDRFGAYRVNYIYMTAWTAASLVTALLNGTSMGMLYFAGVLNGVGIVIII